MSMSIMVFIFCVLTIWIGYSISRFFFPKQTDIFHFAAGYVIGTAISVPFVYGFACLFHAIPHPLNISTLVISVIALIIGIYIQKKVRPFSFHLTVSDVIFTVFAFGCSYWLMTKTFHGDASGLLFVGSNNIFDFGLSLGSIRSMSVGGNIPFTSPFFAGVPMFYHVLFNVYCAIWEASGIPLPWVVNGPSILSFAALLIIIYSLPRFFGKEKNFVGWIAAMLTLSHPTMTFINYIAAHGLSKTSLLSIYHLTKYPYAGPYDGSLISIYMTLNNFVNQRHLAIGIALGLIVYFGIWNTVKRTTKWYVHVLSGIVVAGLLYWNIVICVLVACCLSLAFLFKKNLRGGIIFTATFLITIGISVSPYIPVFLKSLPFLSSMTSSMPPSTLTHWPIWAYLWQNFTILPLIAAIGIIGIGKRKDVAMPLIVQFICMLVLACFHHRGFDQKILSFSIMPINVLAAIGLVILWEKRTYLYKASALIFFFILTISGLVDLFVIKNEFAFPIVSRENQKIISWIQHTTDKNAVFVSYADIIDPVVLAGRKNYFGFFGNVGWTDRSSVVKKIYAGDLTAAQAQGVSYVLAPKWEKPDFPYVVIAKQFKDEQRVVYEDERFIVYTTMIK